MRVKIPTGEGVSDDGGLTTIEDGDQFYVVDTGKGAAGDVDGCGNDMEGVPYIECVHDPRWRLPFLWNTDNAGDAISDGVLLVL